MRKTLEIDLNRNRKIFNVVLSLARVGTTFEDSVILDITYEEHDIQYRNLNIIPLGFLNNSLFIDLRRTLKPAFKTTLRI